MKLISFVSMGRNLIATLIGADQKNFAVVDVVKARDGARVTDKALVSRNIAHEIIDTDYPGYVRKQPQIKTSWYWVHPRDGIRAGSMANINVEDEPNWRRTRTGRYVYPR